ncbi:hypothetical protein T10_9836 [Trichinella papuae]|uniref:Uncharacterized protein n=1 Tax=Trichinella papuae TaxID=268474 RepID=A0A0V1MS88_9BILA|nr:hypothetical protein T10_9836 [Trichinella papuae]
MLNNISIATDEKKYSINKVEEASNCDLIISQSLGQSASQSVNQSVENNNINIILTRTQQCAMDSNLDVLISFISVKLLFTKIQK